MDFRDSVNFFHDVNSVAALLKLFFRELPDFLMTGELYEEFIEAASIVPFAFRYLIRLISDQKSKMTSTVAIPFTIS